ncbi:hypothetical protein J4207_06640 [Candidatus Woesearchaeota archaeon]|nr:hypothetical protein [Candidatus Woesearchaeota archaeon]
MFTEYQRYALHLADKLLKDETTSIQNLKQRVSEESKVPLREILRKSRNERNVVLRYVISYVYHEKFGLGPSWIVRLTGYRDHSTVIYGIEQMRAYIEEHYRESERPIPVPEQAKPEPEEYAAEIAQCLVRDPDITIDNLEQRISEATDVSMEAMRSKARDAPTALARHVLCYVLRTRFRLPYIAIARFTGRSDHTTARHSVIHIDSYVMKARERESASNE